MRKMFVLEKSIVRIIIGVLFSVLCLCPVFSQRVSRNVTIKKKVVTNVINPDQYDITLTLTGRETRPKALQTVIVVDVSGSMGHNPTNPWWFLGLLPSGKIKLDVTKQALKNFVDNFFDKKNNPTKTNKLSIIYFSSKASVLFNLTKASSPSQISKIKNQIDGLTAYGATNIQQGMVLARKQFVDNGAFTCDTSRSIILFTDGSPSIAGVVGGTGKNTLIIPYVTFTDPWGRRYSTINQRKMDEVDRITLESGKDSQTIEKNGVKYSQDIYGMYLQGRNTDYRAADIIKNISNAGSYILSTADDIRKTYKDILGKLSPVLTKIPGKAFISEQLKRGITLVPGSIKLPKGGSFRVNGSELELNINKLSAQTVEFHYSLRASPNQICGVREIGRTVLNYNNSDCSPETSRFTEPLVFLKECPSKSYYTVTKTQIGGKNPVDLPGDIITYQIKIKNEYNLDFNDMVVIDTPPGEKARPLISPKGDTDKDGNLDVGETWVYTTSYKVKQSDIGSGKDLVNKVSVTSKEVARPKTSQVSTKVAKIDLKISKYHQINYKDLDNSGSITKGDEVTFVIKLDNDGPNYATDVVVTDKLPVGYQYVSASPNANYSSKGVVWNVGDLAGTTTKTFKLTTRIREPIENSTLDQYNNIALVSSRTKDINTANNTASHRLEVKRVSDLSVSQTVDNPSANVGDIVSFTIKIKNSGSSDAKGVKLINKLPSGYTYLSSEIIQGDASYDELTRLETANIIEVGKSTTMIIKARVNPPKGILNEYKAESEIVQVNKGNSFDPDSSPANNDPTEDDYGSAEIRLPKVSLSIQKTVNNNRPMINTEVTFTVIVTNNSSVKATNIEVLENLPSGYRYISDQADNGQYDKISNWTIPSLNGGAKATLNIKVLVLDSGNHNNIAQILYRDQEDKNNLDDRASSETKPVCVKVYNEFSPNNDGVNDSLIIECIDRYPNSVLKIYNRWGSLVYNKKGYDNTWNGTYYKSGNNKRLPSGTYYYYLDLKDGSQVKKGWIYLLAQ